MTLNYPPTQFCLKSELAHRVCGPKPWIIGKFLIISVTNLLIAQLCPFQNFASVRSIFPVIKLSQRPNRTPFIKSSQACSPDPSKNSLRTSILKYPQQSVNSQPTSPGYWIWFISHMSNLERLTSLRNGTQLPRLGLKDLQEALFQLGAAWRLRQKTWGPHPASGGTRK